MHRAITLVQTDENQKHFWVQLTETGTFPQKPALRRSGGCQQGQDCQQPSPHTQLLPLHHRALPRWHCQDSCQALPPRQSSPQGSRAAASLWQHEAETLRTGAYSTCGEAWPTGAREDILPTRPPCTLGRASDTALCFPVIASFGPSNRRKMHTKKKKK